MTTLLLENQHAWLTMLRGMRGSSWQEQAVLLRMLRRGSWEAEIYSRAVERIVVQWVACFFIAQVPNSNNVAFSWPFPPKVYMPVTLHRWWQQFDHTHKDSKGKHSKYQRIILFLPPVGQKEEPICHDSGRVPPNAVTSLVLEPPEKAQSPLTNLSDLLCFSQIKGARARQSK